MGVSVSCLDTFIVFDAQPVLFLFDHGLLNFTSMFSGSIVAQELTEDSPYRLQLTLPPMIHGPLQQLLLMNLFLDISLPSLEHLRSLAGVASHKVVSNLSVRLGKILSIVLL